MYRKSILAFIAIMALAQSASALIYDDCRGRWKLANTTYTDVSGYGHTLTANNSPTAGTGHYGGRQHKIFSSCR